MGDGMDGRGEGRGVGVVRAVQVGQGGLAHQGSDGDIHDLVHGALAGHLDAQHPLSLAVGDQLDDKAAGAGHIVGLVVHDGDDADGVKALGLSLVLGETGAAHVESGQLADGGAQGAAVVPGLAGDILGHHAALDVGRGAHGRPGGPCR